LPKIFQETYELSRAQITIAVPSLNQGRYLNDALASIFKQGLRVEVFVMDGACGNADEADGY